MMSSRAVERGVWRIPCPCPFRTQSAPMSPPAFASAQAGRWSRPPSQRRRRDSRRPFRARRRHGRRRRCSPRPARTRRHRRRNGRRAMPRLRRGRPPRRRRQGRRSPSHDRRRAGARRRRAPRGSRGSTVPPRMPGRGESGPSFQRCKRSCCSSPASKKRPCGKAVWTLARGGAAPRAPDAPLPRRRRTSPSGCRAVAAHAGAPTKLP